MFIKQIVGRVPTKRVTVQEVTGHSEQEIYLFARDAAGEGPGTLFGWGIDFHPASDSATVSLFTD